MTLALATTTPGEPEIFASLQGEGPSQGRPCAFVRLSRCNLACVWCDTAYTWNFSGRFTGDNRPHRSARTYDRKANQVTLDEADVAGRIAALGQPRLVVTGGEPLLQASALARMLANLNTVTASPRRRGPRASKAGPCGSGLPPARRAVYPERPACQPAEGRERVIVEIETNGTVAPPPALDALVDQYNVSPKLAHSGNPAELALVPERLAGWTAEPRAAFKFVIADPADVDEVLALAERFAIPRERIWLMAEGTDPATLRERESWLSQLCLTHRLTLSKRLHIELFGDLRGT